MRDGQHAQTISNSGGKIYPWLTPRPQVSVEERLGLDLAGLIVEGGIRGSLSPQVWKGFSATHCLEGAQVTTFNE